MAHPYKDQAKSSHNSKTGSMGKTGNLVIPVMRAVGENRAGGVHESSSSGQHQKQAAASGMKRGGAVKASLPTPPSGKKGAAGAGSSTGSSTYPLHKHGSRSGLGRLDKNHAGKPPFKGITKNQ